MFRLLKADEIEVKVKQVKENGSVFLLYKTARTDMDLLDETVGPMNWQSNYKVVNDNLYAGIGIHDEELGWVWKEDCGIESRPDGDGNEKKGEASDAFKRAGFKWGIGRELYTSPFIWISSDILPVKCVNNKYYLKDAFAKLSVSKIEYTDRKISLLELVDEKGRVVYTFPKGNKTPVRVAPMSEQTPTLEPKPLREDLQRMIDTVNSVDGLRNIFALYKDECDEQVLLQACQEKKTKMGWA